jgi:hypothetical protein
MHFYDTFETLIVNNSLLSDVQTFHYLVSSLRGEAKNLIANLEITNENFTVAWSLICNRYKYVKLIAMQHMKHLVNMPAIKKGDTHTLRQLINHVTSHTNAIQILSLNTNMNDLIVNHLLLSVLDIETS